MGPFSYTAPIVADTLKAWLETSGELFVELYKPHSGVSGFFYVLSSYSQYEELMANAKPDSVSFVLRDRQLSVRGVVDEGFVLKALEQIPNGEHYIIIKPCKYPDGFSYMGGGNTHAELKSDLEELRGVEVWVGVDLKMPDEYWKENLSDDVLIANNLE